jgi:predicted kinase
MKPLHEFLTIQNKEIKRVFESFNFGQEAENTALYSEDELLEKLITFGNKAYPKFGNVVILAGGAGSGKGFVQSNLLGIEGNTFDVDALKELAIKSEKLAAMVKEKTGKDIKGLSLKDPKNVSLIHMVLDGSDINIIDKRAKAKYASILTAPADRKPNLIFDVTLKNMNKLREVTSDAKDLGYDPKNIHVVWVINDYETALTQNAARDRVVPEEILMDTHRGAAQTAKDILDMGSDIKTYLDGDIWYVFNNAKSKTDTRLIQSPHTKGAGYIEDAHYIKVKEAGKPINKKKVDTQVKAKIKGYVPPSNYWN